VARTLQTLVRETSTRYRDYILSVPTASGTTTTLVDTSLNQHFPQDVANAFVYVFGSVGPPAADASNQGVERRAKQWSAGSSTITFSAGAAALPAAPTTGQYEIRRRFPRSRVVEAINDAIGQLNMYAIRPFEDTSITTSQNTWQYTLPNSQNWGRVSKVEIQISTDTTLVGYPYVDATPYNWSPHRVVDSAGVVTWYLQFGTIPPPGRTLRVYGEGYYPDLAAETDLLAYTGKHERAVLTWIYNWAMLNLDEWDENASYSGDTQKAIARRRERLDREREEKLPLWTPTAGFGRIIIPGRGDGTYSVAGEDPNFLGALRSSAITNPTFAPFGH
jgi:hypothetical protein